MTYAIGVASELDVAEVLTLGPQPVEAMASAVGAQSYRQELWMS
jgi:hypothetical protein